MSIKPGYDDDFIPEKPPWRSWQDGWRHVLQQTWGPPCTAYYSNTWCLSKNPRGVKEIESRPSLWTSRIPNARHYDDFKLEGNKLIYKNVDISDTVYKGKGDLRAAGAINKYLNADRVPALRFTEYTTPKKGSKAKAQKLLNNIEVVQKEAQLEKSLDDTKVLCQRLYWTGTKGVRPETPEPPHQMLEIQMILYDS